MITRFYKPTPKKWRIIGDLGLALLVVMQPMISTMPATEQTKWWVTFFMTIGLVGFKFLTNLFKEDEVKV